MLQSRGWNCSSSSHGCSSSAPVGEVRFPRSCCQTEWISSKRGQWVDLVGLCLASSVEATNAQARRRRRIDGDDAERGARRAFHMVQLGEVSAGRQVLDVASLATGDQMTKKALEDPSRHPAVPRDPNHTGLHRTV